ncbi:MAG: hypothetical protein AAGB25_02965 [Pseudomonadota bacterium]
MIWVYVLGGIAALGLAFVCARTWAGRALVFAAALAGLGAYAMVGDADAPDQPLEARLAALGEVDPEQMTLEQRLALWQSFARAKPEDPIPHRYIGDLLSIAERDAAAMRAYQSALRRDPAHAPALSGLADLLVRGARGDVSAEAARLYAAAYSVEPRDVRSGFMAGLNDWQEGRRDQANARWDALRDALPEGAPIREGLAQMRAGLEASSAPEADPIEAERGE